MPDNKIRYGLKNVHIAKCTETVDDITGKVTYTYGVPKAFPGAVALTLDPEGENTPFYADNNVYFEVNANNGYAGSIEMAIVPDWFRSEYLGEEEDTNGVMFENAHKIANAKFAMLFQFEGDVKAVRHCMHYCSVSRASVSGNTKGESVEPQTETLNISARPRQDGVVRCKTGANTQTTNYEEWYASVPEMSEA